MESPRISWTKLLDEVRRILGDGSSDGIDGCKESILNLLRHYKSECSDFEQFIFYHESGYTKNLVVDGGDKYNIIIMCWAPGQSSLFHAHESSRCYVKVLEGQLFEQQVTYPSPQTQIDDEKLDMVTNSIQINDVTYIDDSIGAHRVMNKSNQQPAVTLHIYSPPYTKNRIFRELYIENKKFISIGTAKTLDVNFFSKFGGLSS